MATKPFRRLAVHHDAAIGLVLRPFDASAHPRSRYVGPAVRVPWGKDGAVEKLEQWSDESDERPLVVQGVAGLYRGFHDSFLILITDSSIAATLFDPAKAIHSVDALLAVPVRPSSRALLAKHATKQAAWRVAALTTSDASTSTDDETGSSATEDDDEAASAAPADEADVPEADAGPLPLPKDPLATLKGPSKRAFWGKNPFGYRTPTVPPSDAGAAPDSASDAAVLKLEGVEPLVAVDDGVVPRTLTDLPPPLAQASKEEDQEQTAAETELDAKVVKETLRELKGMYFSPSIDITHSLEKKYELAVPGAGSPGAALGGSGPRSSFPEPLTNLPLWRRADKRFWWNAHLINPFVEAGLHSYIIVLQQGFVQQTSIALPLQTYSTLGDPSPAAPGSSSVALQLIIISRRSVERPGLRYQRRGANVDGGTANFVETEFIIGAERDQRQHISSFVQTRGSIPVFWSQSPWALKPPPVLERTPAESNLALAKHFERQLQLYGKQLVVNLAETTGKEAVIVNAYREGVAAMANPEVKYVEWDFHHETKGMRYENISKLIAQIQPDLEEFAYFWATDDQVFSTQCGVARTNCVDCLDRTNVVQSAIARWVLSRHLVHLGVSSQEVDGLHDQLDLSFNGLWADNGDAISREYAGTSALKGDFTRTGKRNIRGALNDASNSVARLLQSTVSDFFKQATIDLVLGLNLNVFAEFHARLEASDPGEILRLAQIRQEAIDTSANFVLSDGEERLAGWTLLSPSEQDTVRSAKYEEKVLLLSTKAIYIVSYEYTLQKVVSFTRIPIGDISGIQTGAYLLSALEPSARDPRENYGFVLSFHARAATERIRTYSMRVKPSSKPSSASVTRSVSLAPSVSSVATSESIPPSAPTPSPDVHFFAFKALRREVIRLGVETQSTIIGRGEDGGKSGKAVVESIVARLREECEKVGGVAEGDTTWVTERDIIGLAEAEAQTTLLNRLGHKIQSLIWL